MRTTFYAEQKSLLNQCVATLYPEMSRENRGLPTGTFGTEIKGRPPGGIRVTEERELFQLRHALTQYPAAVTAIFEAAERMRRPVDTISFDDVESAGSATSH